MAQNPRGRVCSRRTFVVAGMLGMAGVLPCLGWADDGGAAKNPGVMETGVAPSTCGALRVEGAQLVAEDGTPVQLRGVSTHGLAWFPQFVNEDCFRQLRDEWGASVVRLAMYTAESGGWCTDGDRDQLRALIDTGVQAATAADLYVIVDWHILSDNDPNTYRDDAVAFFDEMSARYAGQNNVLYEICNEPNGATTWQDVKDYAASVIPAIRANAADAVILVGTPTWSQRVDEAAADPITGFDNLMYTLHFYAATHKDDLRATLATAVEDGLPVFVSEFGICDASGNGRIDEGQADEWVALLDRLGISYVMWSLSNKDESASVVKSACDKTSGFGDDDLAEAGLWLRATLEGTRGVGASNGREGASADADAGAEADTSIGSDTRVDADAGAKTSAGTAGAPSTGGIGCTAALRTSWEADGKTCLLYDLTVTNESGADCSSWSADLTFTEVFEIQDSWNGTFAADGNVLHVRNTDYNGTLAAGQSLSDVGAIVAGGPGLGVA